MLFTIELRALPRPVFRYQKNDTWRKLTKDISLHDGDFTTDAPSTVTSMSDLQGTIVLDGETYDLAAGEWPTKNTHLHYDSNVFRHEFPAIPSKEQLVATIRNGDDTQDNVLVLNANGSFELRQVPAWNPLSNDPSYIVRHETCIQGNDYVGPEASEDEALINEHYVDSLARWLAHLQSHRTQDYSDHCVAEQSETQMLESLRQMAMTWKADY